MTTLLDYLLQNEPSFRKARLPALYSDFRSQRTLNPDGYAANIAAWRSALAAIARSGLAPASKSSTHPNLLVLDCNERLIRALESKQFGRPLALGAVFAEAAGAKDIITLKEFMGTEQSIYYKPWMITSPWAVAAWTLRQLGVADLFAGGRGDKIPTGQFVVLANLEAAAKEFAQRTGGLSSRFERTFSKSQFGKVFRDQLIETKTLSATDVDVLLRFLSRDKNLVLYDGKTVKIRAHDDPDANKGTISEEDASIAQLKELLSYLSHQTSVLSKRVDELADAAKQAVAKKNRVAALAALKSKKLAETTLAARFATLSQLEETAGKIQQAADNVALVRVMESSGEALRKLNAAVGGVEGVEGVVDKLRGQMDTADEVNSILADAQTAGGVVVDEGEIDDELAAIEAEERAKEEAEQRKMQEEERKLDEARKAAEAEEVRKRLDAAGKVPEMEKEKETRDAEVEAGAADATEELSRMSLEPTKEAEPRLAAQ